MSILPTLAQKYYWETPAIGRDGEGRYARRDGESSDPEEEKKSMEVRIASEMGPVRQKYVRGLHL